MGSGGMFMNTGTPVYSYVHFLTTTRRAFPMDMHSHYVVLPHLWPRSNGSAKNGLDSPKLWEEIIPSEEYFSIIMREFHKAYFDHIHLTHKLLPLAPHSSALCLSTISLLHIQLFQCIYRGIHWRMIKPTRNHSLYKTGSSSPRSIHCK